MVNIRNLTMGTHSINHKSSVFIRVHLWFQRFQPDTRETAFANRVSVPDSAPGATRTSSR